MFCHVFKIVKKNVKIVVDLKYLIYTYIAHTPWREGVKNFFLEDCNEIFFPDKMQQKIFLDIKMQRNIFPDRCNKKFL